MAFMVAVALDGIKAADMKSFGLFQDDMQV